MCALCFVQEYEEQHQGLRGWRRLDGTMGQFLIFPIFCAPCTHHAWRYSHTQSLRHMQHTLFLYLIGCVLLQVHVMAVGHTCFFTHDLNNRSDNIVCNPLLYSIFQEGGHSHAYCWMVSSVLFKLIPLVTVTDNCVKHFECKWCFA